MTKREFHHYLKAVNDRLEIMKSYTIEVEEIRSLLDQLNLDIQGDLDE